MDNRSDNNGNENQRGGQHTFVVALNGRPETDHGGDNVDRVKYPGALH